MKALQACSIDSDLKHKAKKLNINISQVLNNTLKGIICQYEGGNVDMIALEEELISVRDKISNLKLREAELLSTKISFEERIKQQQQMDYKQDVAMANLIKQKLAGDLD